MNASIDYRLHLKSARIVNHSSGKPRRIVAKGVIWEISEYLIAGWGYDIPELLDYIEKYSGDSQFDDHFEYEILLALTAQLQCYDTAANHNLFQGHPTRSKVRLDHPVWTAHRPPENVGAQYRYPTIILKNKEVQFSKKCGLHATATFLSRIVPKPDPRH